MQNKCLSNRGQRSWRGRNDGSVEGITGKGRFEIWPYQVPVPLKPNSHRRVQIHDARNFNAVDQPRRTDVSHPHSSAADQKNPERAIASIHYAHILSTPLGVRPY